MRSTYSTFAPPPSRTYARQGGQHGVVETGDENDEFGDGLLQEIQELDRLPDRSRFVSSSDRSELEDDLEKLLSSPSPSQRPSNPTGYSPFTTQTDSQAKPPRFNFSQPVARSAFIPPAPLSSIPPASSRSQVQQAPFRPNLGSRPAPPAAPNPFQAIRPNPVALKKFIPPLASTSSAVIRPSSNRPHSFPIPANGNTSRRQDEHLRPDPGNSIYQTGFTGSSAHYSVLPPAGGRTEGGNNLNRLDQNQAAQVIQKMELDAEDYFDGDDAEMVDAVERAEDAVNNVANPFRAAPQATTQVAVVPKTRKGIKLRPVGELPDLYRSVFKFGVFNAVQSTCFDTIYHSSVNVVVSAPTGAGKTVLFELAMLRLFSDPVNTSSKVVYMAPTKSLCSERARDWKIKFGRLGLGWDVVELTGDSSVGGSLRDVGEARIIVTTPEKWDGMTRKWHSHAKLLAKFRLFCIDEVHLVGETVRGSVLEVVVSRIKALGSEMRFIALSATIPNVEDVASWLAEPKENAGEGGETIPAAIFKFGDEFRPCQLQKVVAAYPPKGNDWSFQSQLNFKLMELVKQYASGKPVLIFCNTRKGCTQSAEALAKEYRELLASNRTNQLPWPKPPRLVVKPMDSKLANLMEIGIAAHHAGMDNSDRRLIEEGFINGSISIVCATSTLAVGVNLPARMVIIKGTKKYVNGRNEEYSDLDILQMMGRAGRPQFDTKGVACIMTEYSLKNRYEKLINSETVLESGLHKSLTEHLNSEINLRTITSFASAIQWLRSTFLFVRIRKNPKYYALAGSQERSPTERLEEICLDAVNNLVSSEIVDEQADSDFLTSTVYGDMMSKYYLSHQTFLLLKAAPEQCTMRGLLEILSKCAEFNEVRFRQGEKTPYGKVNKQLKYQCPQVFSGSDKVNIMIQSALQGIPSSELKVDATNPSVDVAVVWPHAVRIVKCLVDLALETQDGVSAKNALELLRSLNCKAWDGTHLVLRQLDGVGEKSIKVFADKGYNSLEDISNADPSRLEMILNRNPPFGRKLITQARSFPQFTLDVLASEFEEILPQAVRVHLRISVGLAVVSPPPVVKKGFTKYLASVLLLTSDGKWIEYRRMPVEAFLDGKKDFGISVDLVKPSQKIVATVSCNELAGLTVRTVYKPTTLAASYPRPTINLPEHNASSEEIGNKELDLAADDPSVKSGGTTGKSQKNPPPSTTTEETPIERPPPVQLANGNYACNHACADKTKCRHFCCRDGLAKPPKAPKPKIKPSNKEAGPTIPKRKNSKAKESMISKIHQLEGTAKFDRPPVKARRIEDFYSTGPSESAGITVTKSTGGTSNRFKAVPKVVAGGGGVGEDDGSEGLAPDLESFIAQNKAREREAYLRRPISDSDSDPVVAREEEEEEIETSGDEAIKELATKKKKGRPVVKARRIATGNKEFFIGRHRLDSDEEEALPTLEEMARDPKPKTSKKKDQTFNFTDSESDQLAPPLDEQDSRPSSPILQRSDPFLHSPPLPPVDHSSKVIPKITSPPPKPLKRTRFESPLPTSKRQKSFPVLPPSSDDPVEEDFDVVGDQLARKGTNLFTLTSSGSSAIVELEDGGLRGDGDEMEIEEKNVVERTAIQGEMLSEGEEEMEEEDDMDAWLSANVTVVD